MLTLQLLGILGGIILASAVLLRAAVAVTNGVNQFQGSNVDIRTPTYERSIITMIVALVPAFIWTGLGLPGVYPSSVDHYLVPALIALPVSLAITGGILAFALATTWRRGVAVAFFLNVLALVLFGVANIAARIVAH